MSKIKSNIRSKIIAFANQKQQLAFCSITGISITIETPAIQGFALEYKNPYSILKNAIDIGKMNFAAHNKMPPAILAGCLLTLLSHYHKLADDKISAAEHNLILQQASPYALHSMLSLFATKSKETISYYPAISFANIHTEYGVSDMLMNYYKAQTAGVEIETTYTVTAITKRKEKSFYITSTMRAAIKNAISSFLANNACNAKLVAVIKLCGQKNNILEISDDIFQKMINKLMDINTSESLHLADIFQDCRNKKNAISVEDTISRFSDDYKKPKTLKEIIAEKLAIARGEIPASTNEIEENVEEEEVEEEYNAEEPIFPHLTCKDCIYEKQSCIEEIGYCYAMKEKSEYAKEVAAMQKHESIVLEVALAASELGYSSDFNFYNAYNELIDIEEAEEDSEEEEEENEQE
jgi:hypothetical protein